MPALRADIDLRNALRAEIDKDFVRMPVHEIEKHLAA